MYVQAVVCFLFPAIKKNVWNVYFAIFTLYHLVFFWFLGFFFLFFCLIDGFEKCISNIQSLYLKFDAFSKFRHIIELSRDH